ncbi:MAG TPA: hypothetical protein VMW27_12825 [Thermoanaerobaculia bacterium]|nr:hypothetical protein [Thermoanaerobaculia bacterium]
MAFRQAALGFLGLLLVLPPAWADAAPHLLGNLNREPPDPVLRGMPSNFFQFGERLFFSTADPESLDQGILWSTDGSARGTQQVSTTLCTDHCAAILPLGTWRGIMLLRIKILRGAHATYRLGRTDGTAAGTFLLTEELYNSDGLEIPSPLQIYVVPGAGAFFFPACRGRVCSLWRSDGTVAGTVPFLSLDGTRFLDPYGFTAWRQRLYFVASHGEGGARELWSTDGTAGGTRSLHVQEPRDFSNNRPGPLMATPSHLFFTSGTTNEDLWVTDGSPEGTRRVADFAPTLCDPYCETPGVYSISAWGDAVFFGVRPDGGPLGIWGSDGTRSGTRPLRELPPEIYEAVDFQRFGGGWLFQANDAEGYGAWWAAGDDFQNAAPLTLLCEGRCPTVDQPPRNVGPGIWVFTGYIDDRDWLWRTDGVRAQPLAEVCPGFDLSSDDPDLFPGPDGKLYFRGCPQSDEPEQRHLWVTDGSDGSDGSPAGTYRIGGEFSAVGFFGGQIYFGSSPPAGPGAELWVSDGKPGLGRRVAALRRYRPGSDPEFQAFGNRVLLAVVPGVDRVGLWTSDGTRSGTLPVAELPADADRLFVAFLDPLGSRQLFTVARLHGNGTETAEIWRTDGTPQGTETVATLPDLSFVDSWTLWNGKLLFCAYQGGGSSIGVTDGTAPGTREILVHSSSFLCPVAALGSRFAFLRYEEGQTRLFVSDGSPAGTRPIATFAGSYGWLPVQLGGTIYFGLGSQSSSQLWQTDGTPEGTRLVLPLTGVGHLQAFRGSLYMTAELREDSRGDQGFFRFRPGTAPVLLKVLRRSWLASRFAAAGDRLVFSMQGDHESGFGFEIWATDGTPGGTQRLHTFQRLPNDPFPYPENLVSDGRRVFFAAGDGVHGREIWESDGTPEGTRLVVDLAPGGYSAIPAANPLRTPLLPANGYLFFAADDGKVGVEPWALPLNP